MMKNKHGRKTLKHLYIDIQTSGHRLVTKIELLAHEMKIRRLVVKQGSGRPLFEIPLLSAILTGAFIALFAPLLAVLGLIVVYAARLKAAVERYPEPAYIKVKITEENRKTWQ
jgi:hypothetical protein